MGRIGHQTGLSFIYIPLCFLLIRSTRWTQKSRMFIYIPLCFLLILKPEDFDGAADRNLHSTMFSINPFWETFLMPIVEIYIPLCFLLIFRFPCMYCELWIIYIPLCFLLIRGMHGYWLSRDTIYIPLCFLLIKVLDTGELAPAGFTFHYVFY